MDARFYANTTVTSSIFNIVDSLVVGSSYLGKPPNIAANACLATVFSTSCPQNKSRWVTRRIPIGASRCGRSSGCVCWLALDEHVHNIASAGYAGCTYLYSIPSLMYLMIGKALKHLQVQWRSVVACPTLLGFCLLAVDQGAERGQRRWHQHDQLDHASQGSGAHGFVGPCLGPDGPGCWRPRMLLCCLQHCSLGAVNCSCSLNPNIQFAAALTTHLARR